MNHNIGAAALRKIAGQYSIWIVLLAMIVISTLINPNFLSSDNLSNVSRQISVSTILAFGETILIICGLLDLSSGSVIALSGVLSVSCFKLSGSLQLAFFVAIMVAVAANLVNGFIVTRFGIPAFIATLAMQAMARGAALLFTKGQNILQIDPYKVFGHSSVAFIPTPVVFLIVLFLFTWYILKHTGFGRSLFAIGGNEEAAVASGINVNRSKMLAFAVNGVLVGVAAVLFMSRVNQGAPNGAINYEFQALTASIIGGTSFSGGVGSAGGTVCGAFIVGFLDNIMNLANVDSYLQQIVRGAIIALAVIYDIQSKRRRERQKLGTITQKTS